MEEFKIGDEVIVDFSEGFSSDYVRNRYNNKYGQIIENPMLDNTELFTIKMEDGNDIYVNIKQLRHKPRYNIGDCVYVDKIRLSYGNIITKIKSISYRPYSKTYYYTLELDNGEMEWNEDMLNKHEHHIDLSKLDELISEGESLRELIEQSKEVTKKSQELINKQQEIINKIIKVIG